MKISASEPGLTSFYVQQFPMSRQFQTIIQVKIFVERVEFWLQQGIQNSSCLQYMPIFELCWVIISLWTFEKHIWMNLIMLNSQNAFLAFWKPASRRPIFWLKLCNGVATLLSYSWLGLWWQHQCLCLLVSCCTKQPSMISVICFDHCFKLESMGKPTAVILVDWHLCTLQPFMTV